VVVSAGEKCRVVSIGAKWLRPAAFD